MRVVEALDEVEDRHLSLRVGLEASPVEQLTLVPPSFWVMLGLGVAICAVGMIAARMRIRAVEVVSG